MLRTSLVHVFPSCVYRAQSNKDLTREIFVKHGCVNAKIYTSTFNMLQQALGAVRRVDLQHLVMQFGCTSCRSVKAHGPQLCSHCMPCIDVQGMEPMLPCARLGQPDARRGIVRCLRASSLSLYMRCHTCDYTVQAEHRARPSAVQGAVCRPPSRG